MARALAAGRLSPSSRPSRIRFSRPERSSSTEAICPVRLTRPRTASASRTMSCPSTRALPPSGASSVASMRIVVVLPAPFGPSTPYTEPRRTARSTPSTARTSPKVLTRPEASIARFVVISGSDSRSGENSSWSHRIYGSRVPVSMRNWSYARGSVAVPGADDRRASRRRDGSRRCLDDRLELRKVGVGRVCIAIGVQTRHTPFAPWLFVVASGRVHAVRARSRSSPAARRAPHPLTGAVRRRPRAAPRDPRPG